MALPSTYKEVEYIQSSGTQYINTGFIPSNTTKVEWKMGGWTQSGSHQMFGSRYAWGSSGRGFAIVTDAYQFNGNVSVSHGMTNGTDHIGEFSQSGLIVDGVTKATPSTSTFTSPGALFLFGLNNNGTFSESAIMKYYYFKIYDSGTLVRDFVPCYRKSDNVTGIYDLVNDQFYTNAGTGTFIRGPIKDRGIPDDYTLVECIESSGTQYIDTGYIPSNNTKVELKMSGWSNIGTYSNLFGARLNWSASGNGFILGYNYNASTYFGMFGQWYDSDHNGWSGTTLNFIDGNEHTIEMSQSGVYQDGTLKSSFTSMTFTSPNSMSIFGDNNNGTTNEKSAYKLYYFKIRDNGTLYRDFVPVIRKSDNKPGMYDIVTDTFYTNAGTGEFNYKKYPESGKIQKIYIGVNQSRPGLAEHTVVYDDIPFKTDYLIAESGYNIKQIILEWSAHYSLTSWQVDEIFLTSPSNSNLRLRTTGQLGGTYGYDYGEGIGKYIGQTFDVNSSANHYSVFASPNSSYAGTYDNAGYVTITKDTVDYKIGQTYGTWLWTGTVTLSTQLKGYMETLLNSNDIVYKRSTWGDNNDLFTYYKATVTYEPV